MLEVRAKVAAFTALSGERKDWGFHRAWERDYLANVRLGFNLQKTYLACGVSQP